MGNSVEELSANFDSLMECWKRTNTVLMEVALALERALCLIEEVAQTNDKAIKARFANHNVLP